MMNLALTFYPFTSIVGAGVNFALNNHSIKGEIGRGIEIIRKEVVLEEDTRL